MHVSPWTRPSAFVPVGLSLVALVLVLGHAAIVGIVREADEGTAAHFFQLRMVAQVPLVAWYAFRWLPRAPEPAARVPAIQVGAALAAVLAVVSLT